jgi:hypothetical protein
MKSPFNTSLPARSSGLIAPLLLTLCLVSAASALVMFAPPAAAQPTPPTYYSDLLRYAIHDPAWWGPKRGWSTS